MPFRLWDPLRFETKEEEGAFLAYAMRSLLTMQVGALIGGFILFVEFVGDRGIDPQVGDKTVMLRGLVLAPIVWAAAGLCFVPRLRRYVETIALVALLLVMVCLVVIVAMLKNGFDNFALAPILVFFFAITFVRFRLPFYIALFVFSWVVFALGAYLTPTPPRLGLLLANHLWIGVAVAIGMIAVVTREIELRSQFRQARQLAATQQRIEDFLGSVASPEEIVRIKERGASVGATIAISYRRSDSDAMAGRIRDRLVGHFGAQSVFMDIHNIPAGFDFRPYIEKVLEKSDVLLAIVGPNWLGQNAQRLEAETDPVRLEIEIAQRRKVPIVPVLVGGASMPAERDLPPALIDFAYCQALRVETGYDFAHHMSRLVNEIDRLLTSAAGAAERLPAASPQRAAS